MTATQKKIIQVFVGIILINALLVAFGLWVFNTQIKKHYTSLRLVESQLAAFDQRRQSSSSMRSAIDELEVTFSKVQGSFVSATHADATILAIVDSLKTYAKQRQLQAEVSSRQIPVVIRGGDKAVLIVSVAGPNEQIRAYLEALEQMNYVVYFEQVQFMFEKDGSTSAAITLVINII